MNENPYIYGTPDFDPLPPKRCPRNSCRVDFTRYPPERIAIDHWRCHHCGREFDSSGRVPVDNMPTLTELMQQRYELPKRIADLICDLLEEWRLRLNDLKLATDREVYHRHLPRCNGNWTEQWDGRVYITHGAGQECPLHGQANGGRLRSYVGTKVEKQAAARAAIANWQDWQKAESEFKRVKALADRIEGDVTRAGAVQQRMKLQGEK